MASANPETLRLSPTCGIHLHDELRGWRPAFYLN